jgi:hypothetical protein
VQFNIAHVPAGKSTWNIYLSENPIRTQRAGARLVEQVVGNFREGSKIEVAFPDGAKGRYLQIQCPRSVSWVMIYEIDVFGPNAGEKARKPPKVEPPH